MKCLILAAGNGLRLQSVGSSKPLVSLLGLALIERVILTANKAGCTDFYVVTGYNGEKLKKYLERLGREKNLEIKTIDNDDWKKANGISVLKAKEHIKENFVLLMSDHIFDESILIGLMNQKINNDEVILAIDYNIKDNNLVDIDDVTKVYIRNNKVNDIGKEINKYNAFDTGIFLCSPEIFNAIERSSQRGDCSLSGGIKLLAKEEKAKTFDIESSYWIDIDNEDMFKKAETKLFSNLKKKSDGPVSRHLNRPISIRISKYLVKTKISPNFISLFTFIIAALGAFFFFLGGYINLVIGGILAQFASIVDGCDGEIARLKLLGTGFGGWFDAVLDRYADGFLLFGITYYVYFITNNFLYIGIGFLAIMGSFMNSYTADKYDSLMSKRISSGDKYFRFGRDVRTLIIFIGALMNQPLLILILIAAISNIENFRRIVVVFKDEKSYCLNKKIEQIINKSSVPEDPIHSKNTLKWLLKFRAKADEALKIAALGHDIERAIDDRKVSRNEYKTYEKFKDAHALNSAKIIAETMEDCKIDKKLIDDVYYLVRHHEHGGTGRVNVLRDADTVSFFDVNLQYYFKRNNHKETKHRWLWGYNKLPSSLKNIVTGFKYRDKKLKSLVDSWIAYDKRVYGAK